MFEKVGGYDETQAHYEDWLLYFKLASVGAFGYIAKKLSVYHTDFQAGSEIVDYEQLYGNATCLINGVAKMQEDRVLQGVKKTSCSIAINGFVVSLALLFARAGEKTKALGMLLDLKSLNFGSRTEVHRNMLYLVFHILIPKWMLTILRKIKN